MLDLTAIQEGLCAELERVPGLYTYSGIPEAAVFPAAIVDFLDPAVDYQKAFSGGAVQVNLRVLVLVERVDARGAQILLNEYASAGTGRDRSIFDVITTGQDGLANTWGGTIASCVVTEAAFDSYQTAGVDGLGVEFTIEAYCDRK